jgi:nucleoside-diphosphate-sugar epimerase
MAQPGGMNILVTGATGYIGTAVAEALARAGHQVTALVHSDASAARAGAAGHAVARGSLGEPATVATAARAADAVVWTATANDGAVDRAALDAALAAVGPGAPVVYTSGVWVHGDTGGAVADEDRPLAPTPLVAWRPAAEAAVLTAPGVRGIVVRPGIVYGRGGGIPALLRGWARRGPVRLAGGGDNHWPVVHVDDLADLYVRAVERAPRGTVLLAAADHVRPRELAAAAGAAVVTWPLAEARAELGAFADALALDQRVSSARARTLLGWQPSRPSVLADLASGSYAT